MIKNIITSTLVLIAFGITNAQVGINTDSPSATLDVVADKTTATYAPLVIKNNSNQTILKSTNQGDFYFSKALMPNANAGTSGQYLISQGPNTAPVWGKLELEYGEILVQEFNAANNDANTLVSYFQGRTIDFSNIYISPSSEIGYWNTANKSFRVNKRGLYHITVGLEMRNMYSNMGGYPPNIALITIAGSFDQSAGNLLYTSGGAQHISTYGVMSVILNPGEEILVYVSNAQNTMGYIGTGSLNIQYSEID